VPDVIVVGAGLPGLTAAWRLAQAGLSVTVFDRTVLGGGSSSLAAGHVPATADEASELAVKLRTRDLVREIGEQTAAVVWFQEVGGLELATGQAGRAYLVGRAARKQDLGCDATLMSPAEIGAQWPMLRTADLSAGIWTPGDWLVRSVYLAVGLAGLARQAGVTIVEGCPVGAVAAEGERVTGVRVGGDHVAAGNVVLAAGAGTRRIAKNSGIELPLRLAALDLIGLLGIGSSLPFISEFTPGADKDGYYLINPVPGWLLAGAPARDGESAGSFGGRVAADPSSAAYLRRVVSARVSEPGRAVPESGWSGLLETTPDGQPLVGRWPPVRGLYLASGFGGGGVQRMSAAEVVAAEIAGTDIGVRVTEFEAARFAGYTGADIPLRDGPYATSGP
jgi:glycine/D-amino acid oxidase-like deaminating enzyme